MPKQMTAPEKKKEKAMVSADVTECRSNAYRDRAMKKKIQAPER